MKNKSLNSLQDKIDSIKTLVGEKNDLIIKELIICKASNMEAVLIYIDGLVNNQTIDRDILKPLMFNIEEDLSIVHDLEEYLCKKYISLSNTYLEEDINNVVFHLKRGKTILIIPGKSKFIILDTTGGSYRNISDPINETSVRSSREGFIEKLETNISLLRRRIRDNNLVEEKLVIGRRSQTDVVLMYIDNIADKNIVADIKSRLSLIDVDGFVGTGMLEQFIEYNPYSIFPQGYFTERPDIVEANLLEGRIAIIADGTPFVVTVPAVFFEFFEAVEDYTQRTVISSFNRILRYIATFIVITLPAVYITLIKFNPELIPFKFIGAIIESRKGIALTPFMSILSMNIIIDFLREGGLRLPFKIGQTLSVVGGIIIGDAALKAKIVSSTTLLVVGVSTIATFLIPNYEMSISIRLIAYPMLFLGNFLGMFGITIGWFFLIAYLCTLESYGVPYFKIYKSDLKDIFVRSPVYKMNKRPKIIPNSNPTRQSDFRDLFRRKNNDER
ncbi:spore germination protein [Clostridium botulinum]|uniref:Spore germination protein GerA n=1 Tax=Clostridium botulinum (strain Okra / Type B1) TaxID=498213 RepID=B1IN70_CLOBK|nr:spore germination protein [Clostridium botulinum]EKX78930.1 spore germination protein [Clostridium botulinum CFSAN001628]ACA43568.1 spore germination protein GerA [Clostridium botulinum B1 str. Okra]MBD5564167.1 spore germination protein [Clostridium botulinum]MBD5566396.1 spore germination protein [Clostridium botulinum]MBD5569088.1 spore germination protein [Clostridium botulinum]